MKHADLDDAQVVGVHRGPGTLTIDLTRYSTEYIQVRATGVSKEVAEYFIGDRVSAPHPDPSLPLDQVEVAEMDNGILELQGYRKNDSWYVWRIVAKSIEVTRQHRAKAT